MDIKLTKVIVGSAVAGLGLILLTLGATIDNGEFVNMGVFLFPFGFGYLIGSA